MARSAPSASQARHFSSEPGRGEHARAARRPRAESPSCRCRSCRRGRAPSRPRCSASALEDVGPHGEERLGNRRRGDEVEPGRHRQALRRRRHAARGVAAAADERADAVARPPAPSTSGPTATTCPATSSPGMSLAPGGGGYAPSRCSTSGRLTPAAATSISTSPAPGTGSGRSTGRSTSGPPGCAISMQRTVVPPAYRPSPATARPDGSRGDDSSSRERRPAPRRVARADRASMYRATMSLPRL